MLSNKEMFFQGFISILIFALVPLAIKYTSANVFTICLFRLVVTVGLLCLIWRKKITFGAFLTKEGRKLWLIGFIFFMHWITYSYGVKIGGASIGVLGLSTYGIQLIIAGRFFLSHQITKKDVVCLLSAFVGILMIVPSWNFHNEMTLGLALALLSATFFAFIPVMHRKSSKFNQETRIFAQFLGALVGFVFFTGKTHWDLKAEDWMALVFLAVFATLIAHSLWAKISSTISPNITGLAYYTIAPTTILLSYIFLGEKLTQWQMAGAILVIISAIANIIKVE